MIDRTIPYANMILRCDAMPTVPYALPPGYSLTPYQPGFEANWAQMHVRLGDFANQKEAEEYFTQNYVGGGLETERLIFAIDDQGCVAGTVTAWQDPYRPGSEDTVASLHWLVVDEAHQGRGLGRTLTLAALEYFYRHEEFPVYLHTQPWSWKAILLYLSLGFRILATETFAHYPNDYDEAMRILRRLLNPEQLKAINQADQ